MLNINDIYLQILNYEPDVTGYYNFFKKIYQTPIALYEDLQVIEDIQFVDKNNFGFKPCTLSITNFNAKVA